MFTVCGCNVGCNFGCNYTPKLHPLFVVYVIMDATTCIIAPTITYSVVRGCNVTIIVGVITSPITPTDTQYRYL